MTKSLGVLIILPACGDSSSSVGSRGRAGRRGEAMAVSALMARAIFDELRARGHDTSALLEVCGLTAEQLADIRCQVEGERFGELTLRAIALTGDEGIGLALGARTPQRVLQLVGYLLLSSSCLRTACEGALRYTALLADSGRLQLLEQERHAVLAFEFAPPVPVLTRVANDWALSLGYRILRYFAPGGGEAAIQVQVKHARPADAELYAQHFGANVRFRCAQTALRFPLAWMDLPSLHGDQLTADALQAVAEDLLQSRNMQASLAARLRASLRHRTDFALFDVRALARSAGLAPSTLRRLLAEEGLSPLALLDEARASLACAELRRSEVSIKELANRIGYADLSSFHRAFKRWTGLTPASYRDTVS
jgi:AraC-like DNA-binding protein